ncbi:hypothetical protein, partial [Mycolicibacterium sp. CBMA 361]|uniref:hypothetical protein n=1 Tax=Mycolicibacterium sp. CBMA 361 TaxID=2606610 RepID=UPI00193D5864
GAPPAFHAGGFLLPFCAVLPRPDAPRVTAVKEVTDNQMSPSDSPYPHLNPTLFSTSPRRNSR